MGWAWAPAQGSRGSYVHDIDDVPPSHRAMFNGATEGIEATLSPGEALFIPCGWWHHVEQIDSEELPITMTLFANYLSHKRALNNEHDLTRRRLEFDRRVQQNLVTLVGGKRAVEYLRALDHGRFSKKSCRRQNNCASSELKAVHEMVSEELKQLTGVDGSGKEYEVRSSPRGG